MTMASENRLAFKATVEALTATATELEIRVHDLHRALADLNLQMQEVSNALHHASRSAAPSDDSIDGEAEDHLPDTAP
ncbi:hypothetical protein [Streptomyces sp. 142MFCol3.1]|uniref:hypothetical protein n=1 Tax=Streptomyces sp. 142MFCol3.1 TaxID=1172179 RepID=UPI0004093B58|nr:hypothetical protein [Streptomyces sp. 142MFCol3.1]